MAEIVSLKQNMDFHRAYRRGKVRNNPALVTYVLKNRAGICRVGITTSKKLGNAVTRNRCRRIIKSAYSSLSEQCTGAYDIVFVARFKTAKMKSTDIEKIMYAQLSELGVIKQL